MRYNYTKHQQAVLKTTIDLLKNGATEVIIKKHVFGFKLAVKGYYE